MVVPIFISTQYKEAKDLDGNFGAADEVEHIDNPSFECDESVEVEPRDLKLRSVRKPKSIWRSGWFLFCMFVLICMVAVLSFLISSYISKLYGGRHRTGWCKVEYSVESFNRKAQHDFLYGESRHLTRSELPKTDEWIRLKDGVSWELESEGEFNYKIVTDLASDMSALKFEDFLDGKDYCFIGSRYDFGLPSYKDVETFLENLQDKAEILVDHVNEVYFLTAGDLLPPGMYLDPSIRDLCGSDTYKFSVAAINPDNDPDISKVAKAEAFYYSANKNVDMRQLEDIRVVMETLQRLQEVLAYIPSGNYMTQHSSGRVVSFEIVHPKSVMYLTSGSLSQYPAIQQGSNEIKEKINNNNDNSKVAE
ncbi:uncharacterized protein LOC142351949 [Convolutriloba macropyga]|uniref:uncharacterized protein LOC142351949 n=1 Tax=Convolutriloba macropyga TaxID=536237 RepID=UPI003F51E5A0